jgi:hypothetical protein
MYIFSDKNHRGAPLPKLVSTVSILQVARLHTCQYKVNLLLYTCNSARSTPAPERRRCINPSLLLAVQRHETIASYVAPGDPSGRHCSIGLAQRMSPRQVQLPFVLILTADAALGLPPGNAKYAKTAHAIMRPALLRHEGWFSKYVRQYILSMDGRSGFFRSRVVRLEVSYGSRPTGLTCTCTDATAARLVVSSRFYVRSSVRGKG